MKRRFADWFAIVSIALLMVLLPDWFYSYRQSELLILHGPAGKPIIAASGRGVLFLVISNFPISHSQPWSCDIQSSSPTDPASYFEDWVDDSNFHLGYRILPTAGRAMSAGPIAEPDAYGFSLIAGKTVFDVPATYYAMASVPFWAIVPPLGFVSFLWSKKKLQNRFRHREGCCRKCGYDLRASPERCPECGTSIH